MNSRRLLALLLLSSFAFLSLASLPADGQVPGVTVINVPPEFSSLDIRSDTSHQYIDIVVSDYNSWEDIRQVDLQILNEEGSQLAHIAFLQYTDNETIPSAQRFEELLGEVLDRDLSVIAYSTTPVSIEDRTEIRITFVISPVAGRWLNITATDLAGTSAYAQVEIDGRMGDGTALLPPVVLIMFALAAAVILVSMRVRREFNGR